MNRRKILTLVLAAVMCLSVVLLAGCGKKKENTVKVYVTLSDAGEVAGAYKEVEVTDADADGVITISDAIADAHKTIYSGGADGYSAETTDYGLSITKLLGVENGGSYGCYVNNAYVSSLTDAVKEGDYVYAYSYKDLSAWSDAYSYFDKAAVELKADGDVALKLTYLAFDENYNAVETPAAGMTITVDGTATEFVTGEDGSVTFPVSGSGEHIVSAVSDEMVLVPPVCVVTVG